MKISKYLLALVAALACSQALATTTFTSSVTNANGTLTTTLTWNSDRASCVASGHPSWTGTKPKSGMETLPPITMSGTYTLTLACSSPADDRATLSWVKPTTNTDGSPLTNLASYKVYWGTGLTGSTWPNSAPVSNPNVLSFVVQPLTPGPYRFVVTAINANGVESVFSNMATKTVTGSAADPTESVTLTVNPVPSAPSTLTVQ